MRPPDPPVLVPPRRPPGAGPTAGAGFFDHKASHRTRCAHCGRPLQPPKADATTKQLVCRILTPMSDAEIPLQGGRTTPAVLRMGQTVRRPPRLMAEFVHVLLEHLAA